MSGFHPLLGLLAVAVCISYSEGAPFSAIEKDDTTAHKLHNADLIRSVQSAREHGALPSPLYNKENKIAQRDDSLDKNVIDKINYKNINQPAGLPILNNFRSIHDDDVFTKHKAKEPASGSLDADSGESDAILKEPDEGESEDSSSDSEGTDTVEQNQSGASNIDSVLTGSQSEEECKDDENNGGNHGSTLNPEDGEGSSTLSPHSPVSEDGTDEGPITSNPTSPSNGDDEECEDTESKGTTPQTTTTTTKTTTMKTTTTTTTPEPESEGSSSESIESGAPSQESQESEECDDSVTTTTTQRTQQTTRPTKKPRDPDQSSGSFNDSDPDGVDFSDSNSKESTGRSTEFYDK